MFRYLLKRLALAVPTLLIVSVLVFLLGQVATVDPLALRGGANYAGNSKDPVQQAVFSARQAQQYGLDMPLFYVGIQPHYLPDTLYRIFPYPQRSKAMQMARACGYWEPVAMYEQALSSTIQSIERLEWADTSGYPTLLNSYLSSLLLAEHPDQILPWIDSLSACLSQTGDTTDVQNNLSILRQRTQSIAPVSVWTWPKFVWYGTRNQYHSWLKGFLGIGPASGQAYVWPLLRGAVYCSLLVSGFSLLLALVLAIASGLYAVGKRSRWQDRLITNSALVLYATPLLLIACLLRYAFATPGHGWYSAAWGSNLDLPFLDLSQMSFWTWCSSHDVWPKLILPIITLSLHLWAGLCLHVRAGGLTVIEQGFVRTAYAKGLSESRILFRHVLPNSLFPLVTVLSHLVPSTLGGTVLVEAIFNFKGLGDATLSALRGENYPMLMAIILMGTTITLICSFMADLMYAVTDPRIRYGESSVLSTQKPL